MMTDNWFNQLRSYLLNLCWLKKSSLVRQVSPFSTLSQRFVKRSFVVVYLFTSSFVDKPHFERKTNFCCIIKPPPQHRKLLPWPFLTQFLMVRCMHCTAIDNLPPHHYQHFAPLWSKFRHQFPRPLCEFVPQGSGNFRRLVSDHIKTPVNGLLHHTGAFFVFLSETTLGKLEARKVHKLMGNRCNIGSCNSAFHSQWHFRIKRQFKYFVIINGYIKQSWSKIVWPNSDQGQCRVGATYIYQVGSNPLYRRWQPNIQISITLMRHPPPPLYIGNSI